MEPEVRAADPSSTDDAQAIAEIYAESLAVGDASLDEEPWSAEDVLHSQACFGPGEGYLVLEDGARVVGWGLVKRYSERRGYRFTCETAVYLRRDHVRRGLGTRLGRALIERCREAGYHHLVAKVLAANEGSVEYHRQLGYEVVGRQREVGWRDGRWCDVVILQLLLGEPGTPVD